MPTSTDPDDFAAFYVNAGRIISLNAARERGTMQNGVSQQVSVAVHEVQFAPGKQSDQQDSVRITPRIRTFDPQTLSSYASIGLKDKPHLIRFKPQHLEFNLTDQPRAFVLKFTPNETGTHYYVVTLSGKNASGKNVQTAGLFIVKK